MITLANEGMERERRQQNNIYLPLQKERIEV